MAYGWNHLYYAWYDGTIWRQKMVDSADTVGAYASLALDSAGNPHISYCDQTNNVPKYASWTGTLWQIRWVANEGGCKYTSLVIDRADMPQISYATDTEVKYARWTGRNWDVQTIGSGHSPDLAVDNDNHPHIAYIVTGSTILYYTWYDGESWHEESLLHFYNSAPSIPVFHVFKPVTGLWLYRSPWTVMAIPV
jgi:hypothetical protein